MYVLTDKARKGAEVGTESARLKLSKHFKRKGGKLVFKEEGGTDDGEADLAG
jgi:hypothetical protein